MDSKPEVKDIELVDIEDIVPFGGNSIFLCLARVLIYMSHKNSKFTNALNLCCGLARNDLKSDVHLQNLLRIKLCDYWLKNGIFYDPTKKSFCLSNEYSNYFNGNVYDFLIQVYQMSINNFSNNSLFKKYALGSLCKLLKVKIYYKKTNGQWKCYGPNSKRNSLENKLSANENENMTDYVEYLNSTTIYLQEFKSDSSQQLKEGSNNIFLSKNIRFLLDKKLWLSNYQENSKICMKFSQFNDKEELKLYQDVYFLIDHKKILHQFLSNKNVLKNCEKIFCVFLYKVPVEILIRSFTDQPEALQGNNVNNMNEQILNKQFEFSLEFNTIGKQISRFEGLHGMLVASNQNEVDKSDGFILINYLNYLWGVNKFNQESVNKYFVYLTSQ